MNVIRIKTDGTSERLDVPNTLTGLGSAISARMVETVRIDSYFGVPRNIVMVVDEEGLLKESPVCNPVGSHLYATPLHGHPIMGDILLASMNNVGDFVSFDPAELEKTLAFILRVSDYLEVGGRDTAMHREFDGKTIQHFPPTLVAEESLDDVADIMGFDMP